MSIRLLLSASTMITTGMIVGRILGLLREMLIAAQFGTSETANMAIILLIIPDFVAAAFIGSAVSAVLLPAFASRSPERILALMWQTLALSCVLFIVIALLCAFIFFGSHDFVSLMIAFCSMPLAAMTAALTAYLQYRGKFLVPAFANAIFNVVVLFTLWKAPDNLIILAIGIFAAAFIRLAAHYFAFVNAGGKFNRSSFARQEFDRSLFKAYFHTAGSGICSVLPIYVPYMLVAGTAAGLAAFNYAFKLLLFPAILIQTIIQMVLLPWFVKIRSNSPLESTAIYSASLQVAWAVSLAITLSFSIGAQAIADVCFGYGKMTQADIVHVGNLMALGIWAAPGLIMSCMWQQMLYAHEQTRPPFYANIALAASIAPLCWLGYQMYDLKGVLIANALAQLVPFYLLVRLGRHFVGLPARPSFIYVRISLAVVVTFAVLGYFFYTLNPTPLTAVAFAILIGLTSLAAGLWQCPSARKLLHAQDCSHYQ